jgi:hypothetical protein
MRESAAIVLKELRKHCEDLATVEFDFVVEYWGILWHPWFIEVKGKAVPLSVGDLTADDLDAWVTQGIVTLLKEHPVDGRDDLELLRRTYQLMHETR